MNAGEAVEAVEEERCAAWRKSEVFLHGLQAQPAQFLVVGPVLLAKSPLVGLVDQSKLTQAWVAAGQLFDGLQQVIWRYFFLFHLGDELAQVTNEAWASAQRLVVAQTQIV